MKAWHPNKIATLVSWRDAGFSLRDAANAMRVDYGEAKGEWAKVLAERRAAKIEEEERAAAEAALPPPPPPAPPAPPPPPPEPIPDPEPVPAPPADRISEDDATRLLADCEEYRRRYRLAESQFGILAAREPGLLSTLRKGRRPRRAKAEQIRAVLAAPPPYRDGRGSVLARRARETIAIATEEERAAAVHRLGDEFEQAKRHLQRLGYAVFSASVVDPDRKGWMVGRKPDPLTTEELTAMARRLGWKDPST